MPWVDFSTERRAGQSPTTPLLDQVDAYLATAAPSFDETVLVHGDLWQGNLLYDNDQVVGVIDWEAAGAGNPGIDLGSLRWDAATLFGPSAADEILAGWEAAAGRAATDVAYWDLVAGANTPADLTPMQDAIAQQGRPDLDGPTLTQRRDEFLQSALARI
jgi:aminoglycoside phosphotransferase (APT) family kinase protein